MNLHKFELASLDGLGVTTNANGDYSTPASFRYPATHWPTEVHRVIVGVVDALINNSQEYGGIAALTNGIHIYRRDSDDNILETLTPFPVKTNGDWQLACHDVTYASSLGNGNHYVSVRWTFSKSGVPVVLMEGEYMDVYLSDDFTGIENHTFFFQGFY